MAAAVAAVEDAEGSVGVLVNNAGYSQSGAVESIPLDDIRRQFETNVFGLIRMSQLVLPGMRRAGKGRIVNIGSMGGKLTFPGGASTTPRNMRWRRFRMRCASKCRASGSRSSSSRPGLITTEFAHAAVASTDSLNDGPYADFNAKVGAVTAGIYESRLAGLVGGGPDAVAEVIRKAIKSKHPKARYTVTPSATLGILQRQLTPDRLGI